MNQITELTKDCPREDCSIAGGDWGTMTAVYYPPSYDKHGNRTDAGDGNTFTTSYSCRTCGASWSVSTQWGKSTITPISAPGQVQP